MTSKIEMGKQYHTHNGHTVRILCVPEQKFKHERIDVN